MIITISGNSGSGKSTVALLLKQTLNYELFSVGAFVRSVAAERGLSIQNFHDTNDALKVQDILKEKYAEISKGNNIIVDARTAWIFIPESYKIYLHTSYPVSAQRLISDESRTDFTALDIEAATKRLSLEDAKEVSYFNERFEVRYDSSDNYDLFLQSDELLPGEVHNLILKNLDDVE